MARKLIPLLVISLLLTSCVAGPNPLKNVPGKNGESGRVL